MAIRYVNFQVSEDTTVTPTLPQYGGVQGEHNATEVCFTFDVDGPLANPQYQYFIECVDAAGGYDRSQELYRRGGEVSILLPLAWTQYGGVSTLRLCIEESGVQLYSLEGRLQFSERGAAIERVDGLLRTDLSETLAACRAETDACREASAEAAAAAASAAEEHRAMTAEIASAAADFADAIDALPEVSTAIASDAVWPSRYMADTLCPALAVSGNPVTCRPLAQYPLRIRAQHQNLLAPFPAAPTEEMNGLTFTHGEDGAVTVNGTATDYTAYLLVNDDGAHSPFALHGIEPQTRVMLSGCPAGGSANGYALFITAMPATPTGGITYMREDTGPADTFETVAADYSESYVWKCGIRIAAGTVCDNLVFYPRLALVGPLTLTVRGPQVIETREVAANTALTLPAHGGEMTFSLAESGSVTVEGRQNVESYCGNLDAALDSILALQQSLLGGERV